jgi:hypothetical protein
MATESSQEIDLAGPYLSTQNVAVGQAFGEPSNWESDGGLWMRPDLRDHAAAGMSFEQPVRWA